MHRTMIAASTSYRLQHSGVTIDGVVPLDFARYPFIPEIIDERHRFVTILKGAQMGFTIACIIRALELAKSRKFRGIGYFFPTEGEVSDFAQARFGPMMSANHHEWGRFVKDTNSVSLKRINDTFLYFRGAGQQGSGTAKKSTSKQKSIPLDDYSLDEADEMSPSRIDAIQRRLDGSLDPSEVWLSTPTLPEYGVDMRYAKSDQRVWMWRCTHCDDWTCLEDSYPDCIAEPTGREAFYLCMNKRCGKPLERVRGQWVPRVTEIRLDHAGYWVSQLSSPTRTAQDVIDARDEADEKGRQKEFQNQVLAAAYAEVDEQITEEMLNARVKDDVRKQGSDEGPCAMGVDPGKIHWYQVRKRVSEVDTVVVAQGKANDYETLDRVAKAYNVESGIMDKGADSTSVDNFCKAHAGWYGCLYVEQKSTTPDWNHKEREVKVGRTRLLTESFNDLLNARVSYHRKDEFWEKHFVPQMKNLKKTTITDEVTGDQKSRWVVTGTQKNDHMRHADAYCYLAASRCGIATSIVRAKEMSKPDSRPAPRRGAMTL